ncbi:GNAT family N-acetyltransferase [Pseudoalteromonas sp. NSLLW24]|uniref:GNAT family N-acetyltransferase n=1 Tax=Pseudoalteromonas sp. NSLLW24 TaxID=2792050 RepID=UPI0018CE321B|nr:GNAT family N-acetyltransferase [Pseudoalteromonas sp. NSLLW24]MBH0000838.1 GNAT family N-acetyltransferase [Pseudoalteromonas sp. NSLLW24]
MIEVNKINNLNQIQNGTLRTRAERAQSGRTLEFIAKCDGLESAFLSFEDWSDKSLGFIYEIYVLPEFRNQSLGGSLLHKAEEVAIKLGCTKLQLDVHAFDRTLDKGALYSWYSEKGYVRVGSNSERMEKLISSKNV